MLPGSGREREDAIDVNHDGDDEDIEIEEGKLKHEQLKAALFAHLNEQ